MSALDNLKAEVAAQTTVIDSAVTLIKGFDSRLADAIAAGDPAVVQALSDQIHAETTALADAVAANTPAAVPV